MLNMNARYMLASPIYRPISIIWYEKYLYDMILIFDIQNLAYTHFTSYL